MSRGFFIGICDEHGKCIAKKLIICVIIISSMGKITKYLNQLTVGNVFDEPEILEAYSTDRSVLKVKPKFVALPESTDDIQKLMRFFNQIALRDIPVSVTPRGSGMDEGGADLSSGLVISTEKLNHLLEIDARERLVRVQAGITLRELNTALSVSGLTIPVGGHGSETIGGLISNCPVDIYQGKYGGIGDYVERIEVILSNGECLQTLRLKKYALAKKTTEKSFEGEIYRKMAKLLKEKEKIIDELRDKKPGLSGYAKIALAPKRETLDLTPLFYGSQGTLGVISEVILRAVPLKTKAVRMAATFKDMKTAMDLMDKLSVMKPREMNIYDLKIIQEARETGKNLDGVIKRLENGFVIYVTFDEHKGSVMKKMQRMKQSVPRNVKVILDTPENQSVLSELENALPSYLNYSKVGERVPILTDFYMPAANLVNFMDDLKVLSEKLKLELLLYGSYATGIYSLRPIFELAEEGVNKKIATFLRAGAYVINRQGGVLTGGTPEGRLKAAAENNELTDSEREFYERIKKIFDPNGILNPDVKLGASSRFTLTHLRDGELKKVFL